FRAAADAVVIPISKLVRGDDVGLITAADVASICVAAIPGYGGEAGGVTRDRILALRLLAGDVHVHAQVRWAIEIVRRERALTIRRADRRRLDPLDRDGQEALDLVIRGARAVIV